MFVSYQLNGNICYLDKASYATIFVVNKTFHLFFNNSYPPTNLETFQASWKALVEQLPKTHAYLDAARLILKDVYYLDHVLDLVREKVISSETLSDIQKADFLTTYEAIKNELHPLKIRAAVIKYLKIAGVITALLIYGFLAMNPEAGGIEFD